MPCDVCWPGEPVLERSTSPEAVPAARVVLTDLDVRPVARADQLSRSGHLLLTPASLEPSDARRDHLRRILAQLRS